MDDELNNCLRYILSLYDILTYRQKLELITTLIDRLHGVPDQRDLTIN